MAKKSMHLPDNIDSIMATGSFEELKSLYDKCEINAYFGDDECNLPFFKYTPCSEFYKWLVEQGLDVNIRTPYTETPLHCQAQQYYNNIEGLILAGADIEAEKEFDYATPLYIAVKAQQPSSVKTLLKYGADPDSEGAIYDEVLEEPILKAPIEILFDDCKPINLVKIYEIAEALISAGAEVTEEMKKNIKEKVRQLGRDYKRERDTINTDNIESYDEAMEKLNELFDVTTARTLHNGTDLIEVKSTNWIDQHEELWNLLVPASGPCKTVQGETVRICGHIYDEIINLDGEHWDKDYKKILKTLKNYYPMGKIHDEAEIEEAYTLIDKTTARSSLKKLSRLCEINVHWILNNPNPIPLGEVDYDDKIINNKEVNCYIQTKKLKKVKEPSGKSMHLPNNLHFIMATRNFEELKSLYDKYEINAYYGDDEYNLPFFKYTPCSEFYKWLVEQGLDVNVRTSSGKTPLHCQVWQYYNNVEGLILAGADVNAVTYEDNITPLYVAAKHISSSAKVLLKYGADPNIKGINRESLIEAVPMAPIEILFDNCKPRDLVSIYEVAEALVSAGAEITEEMKEYIQEKVRQLGKEYERARDKIYTDNIEAYDEAMEKLNKLFDVTAASTFHNGTDLIKVTSTDWIDQHEELWNLLVPYSGSCKTVQGETVRICGRVYDEILNLGGEHWDEDYKKMLKSLKDYYKMGEIHDQSEIEEAYMIIDNTDRRTNEKRLSRLCEINVHWVLNNPNPIPLGEVDYER